MAKKGLYAFCIIPTNRKDDFGKCDLGGNEDIYIVPFLDYGMVVVNVQLKIYPPTKVNLLSHQKVISKVMEKHPVIPMSFGNVFRTKEDVLVILRKLYPSCQKIFPEIKDKIEVGLKVFGKKDWLMSEVSKDKYIEELKTSITNKSEDASYYDQILLGEAAQKFIENIREKFKTDIFEELALNAVAAKLNEPIGESMLLNGVFLIEKDLEEEFDQRVYQLYQHWQQKLDFNYTGPWPPYNFIDIKLKIEG